VLILIAGITLLVSLIMQFLPQGKNHTCYPHMPIGKVWIYCLLFVCLCVCTVTDFSAEDKASSVKFCAAVHRRPEQGISHFGELYSPISPKLEESASAPLL